MDKERKKIKRNKIIIIFLIILLLIGISGLIYLLIKPKESKDINKEMKKEVKEEITKEKINIIDINSKTRPIAVSVNNTPIAVKVQDGLNKAYLVYEIPTEGFTSRLLALFKDVSNVKVGTIRSARHNFIDYALESDAIFVCFGWSHYAKSDMENGSIDYIQGLEGFDEGNMWRDNPEGLDWEHRVYLNTDEVYKYAYEKKNYKKESDDTILLNYVSSTDLSKKEESISAKKIIIPYGNNESVFTYDENSKLYTKSTNGSVNKDHDSGEIITTKNIIVQKIDYTMASDNHYWDLKTIGSGDGYYITNGLAVPIKWNKDDRKSKTKYKYLDGKEIEVSDGRTYIEIQINDKNTYIE